LKKLKKLSLKYNQLEIIPSSLSACSDIEEFNIENNLIEEIGMLLTHQNPTNNIF